jgi:hypothetical protein
MLASYQQARKDSGQESVLEIAGIFQEERP